MILNRDDYTCRVCGATSTESDPLLLRFMAVVSWGTKPTAQNTITLCDSCALPSAQAALDVLVVEVERRNKFFGIAPDKILNSLSRGQERRRKRF